MGYNLQRQIFGQTQPLTNPVGSLSTLRSFTGAVIPTEASKLHTTPGETQPRRHMVSSVFGLGLVLLELDKSGAPQPRSFILCTAACKLQHSRRQFRQFSE